LVLTDSNQTLAAEPGFHSDAPRSGGFEVTAIRRFPDYRSELGEQQSESGWALWFLSQPILATSARMFG
jgi:hypothetical protein